MSLDGRMEKRRDKRLGLTLPVKFFVGQEDVSLPQDGVTHNVSSGGVYLEAPVNQVLLSAPVSLRIGVPARKGDDKPNVTLVGLGTVCRIDKLDGNQVLGLWPDALQSQGICGVALRFQQRPTVELQSLDHLLWEAKED